MSFEEGGEEYKCDKEGYFDLDSIKPYASVWVSTRRDARSKSFQQDGESDPKKNVVPSRACNDLHSLLETNGAESLSEVHDQEQTKGQSQLPATKSDHFPLNSYKLYEKTEGFTLRKISDKIIESMCKSESKPGENYSRPGSSTDTALKDKTQNRSAPEDQEEIAKEEVKSTSNETEILDECSHNIKQLNKIEEDMTVDKITREPSRTSHLAGGEPQEDINKPKLLSDAGKLVSEIHLTSINVKDQVGREYPLTVKYVWEIDPTEVLNAHENVFHSSPALLKTIESISSIGLKYEKPVLETHASKMSWQEKSKSQSNCSQRNRRFDSWNSDDREHDSNFNLNSKGDGMLRKGLGNAQAIKSTILRSKVSLAGPYQDKKILDTHNDKKEIKGIEGGIRDNSRMNIADKKINMERKGKVPIKKKLPAVEEFKVPNALARPATFNKRDIGHKPTAARPPSAPSREPRLTQRIGAQDSGDRLAQAFNKRPFGSSKHQSPPAGAGGKFWK